MKKINYLTESKNEAIIANITIDSPIPYNIDDVIKYLKTKDTERIPGSAGKDKNGEYNGKLTRFIQRLEAKTSDKRLNFIFSRDKALLEYDYMNKLCKNLMSPSSQSGGVKIIDFSEVPSDILPLMVSLIARLIFSVQQWMDKDKITPIAIFCDEAHLYIPANANQGIEISSLHSFERIAKERFFAPFRPKLNCCTIGFNFRFINKYSTGKQACISYCYCLSNIKYRQ